MEKAKLTLSDFVFLPRLKNRIVEAPLIPRDELAQIIYQIYENEKKSRFDNNPNFKLYQEDREVKGSNIFDVSLLTEILRSYGLRTVVPADDRNKEISKLANGRFYIDFNAVVLRSVKDSMNPRNNNIAKSLADSIGYEESKGPALIIAPKVEPWSDDSKNYGLKLLTSENSKVVYDDRLKGKWNRYKFDEVDEIGLPKSLDKEKGKRTWYATEDGLSRFSLGRNLGLSSYYVHLVDSYDYGRVVLNAGEASGLNFSDILEKTKKNELLYRLQETRNYLEDLEKELK